MKEQHLPSYCPSKRGKSQEADKVIHQFKFCMLFFFFIACTSAPSDDNSLPLSLYLQPQSIEATPVGGYKVNILYPGQGTGLGLSLSYDIIKAHGGELRFESGKNMETIFYIYLKK
jgi:hypothetical protein